MTTLESKRRISLGDLGREPFRIFFPAGVFAGIAGVSLWPLYFTGRLEFYPGLSHARIMAYGMFGGFIFGFLGTAMPRMLAAKPLRLIEVLPLVLVHGAMVASFAATKLFLGDVLFLVLLGGSSVACRSAPNNGRTRRLPGSCLSAWHFSALPPAEFSPSSNTTASSTRSGLCRVSR